MKDLFFFEWMQAVITNDELCKEVDHWEVVAELPDGSKIIRFVEPVAK